jgi:glucan phosphoethanolaminetransferase (alkaline phosphatase superfamily)
MAYRNRSDLNILSILFFIMAGLNTLVLLIWGAILAMGIYQESSTGWRDPIGVYTAIFIGAMIVAIAVMTGLTCWAAICLRKTERRVFCIVISALFCLSFPLGTALGIYALTVLTRPSVRALFESSQPGT